MATKIELAEEIAVLKKQKENLETRLEAVKANNQRLVAGEKKARNLLRFIVGASNILASPQKENEVNPLDKNLVDPSEFVDGLFTSLFDLLGSLDEETMEKLDTLGDRLKEVVEERDLVASILNYLDVVPDEVVCLDTHDKIAFIGHKIKEMEKLLKGSYDKTTTEGLFRLKLMTVANGR